MRSFLCLLMLTATSQSLAQTATDNQFVSPIYQPLPSQSFTVPIAQPSFNAWGHMPASSQFIDLLGSEHYRKQIDFSKEQIEEYNQLQKEYGEATQAVFAKFPELERKDLPWKERKIFNDKAMLEHNKLKKEFSERAKDTLVPRQLSIIKSMKFRQVEKSFGFAHAVSSIPFSEELKITGDQKKKLGKINSETQAEIQKMMMDMQKKVAELKAKAKGKMLKTLDAKQRKLVKEIEGEEPEKAKDTVYFGAIR